MSHNLIYTNNLVFICELCEHLLFKNGSSVYPAGVSKSSSSSIRAVCLDLVLDLCVRKLPLSA